MATKDRNTCLEQFHEYDRGYTTRRLFRPAIEFAMFVLSIDPFLIYKRTNRYKGATRFQLYQRSQLRMEQTSVDRWRRWWRNFISTVCTYFCMKFSAIVAVQVVLYTNNLTRLQSEREWVDSGDSEQGVLTLISRWLGNPMIGLPGMTIFLYSVFVASISHAILYIPHYYSLKPLNSTNIRIWLEPKQEFRRIDMTILETLEKYNQPLRTYCHCRLSSGWRRQLCNGPHYARMANREIQSRIINMLKSRYWCLRPALYTIEWYKAYDRFILHRLVGPMLAMLFTSLFFVVQQLSSSSFRSEFANYNFFQTLTFLETTCGLGLIIPLIVCMITLFVCDCFCQLYLLRDVEHNLSTYLDELRSFERDHIKDQDHLAAICIMLKPLIKVTLSLQELRYNAEALTELVSVNMVISGTTCISILLAENLDGQDLYLLRVAIMIGLWLWTNLTLIGCAYIYSCATKLENVTWSIMAELYRQEYKKDWLMFEFQVIEFWRRLIISRSFSDATLSVRPFGAPLNYDRALQLNFLALSFAAFSRTFGQYHR